MPVFSAIPLSAFSSDFRWDAEYYRPEFLKQEALLSKLAHADLITLADVSDGNHLTIAEQFIEDGVRYLRGKDLAQFFVSDADPVFIPESTYKQLSRSHMFPGDVLLGIVGTIGTVGLVTERHGKLTGNCKLAIVRPHSIPPEYLAAYLASKVGQNEIQRRIRGSVQMGLILPDLKKIPVILPPDSLLEEVVKTVKLAKAAEERCRSLLEDAEALVLPALGLSGIDLSATVAYERKFSDLCSAHRFGAEYFMPAKQHVISKLIAQPYSHLRDNFEHRKVPFQPEEAKKGELARNYDLPDSREFVFDDRMTPTEARGIGSAKKVVKPGDLVISRLRSYLKEIAIVHPTADGIQSVCSTEFIVLHPKPKKPFSVQLLLVFLRSAPIQTILRWSQDGSQHPRFPSADLLAIPMPNELQGVAGEIEKYVALALSSRAEAAKLLSLSRSKIENVVLGQTLSEVAAA